MLVKKGGVVLKRIIFYVIIIIAFMLITFFGLGPAIFADGSSSERAFTLAVVIFLYIILGILIRYFIKRNKKNKK